MARLTIYPDDAPHTPERSATDHATVAAWLAEAGVAFERWDAGADLPAGSDAAAVRAACAGPIAALMERNGYQSMDIIGITPDAGNTAEMRTRFRAEHTHDEDEARYFLDGGACFFLHIGALVYAVECARGDMLSVPALTPHWLDIGVRPHFTAMRFFTRADGWVAAYTGNPIAADFPEYCR